MEALHLLKRSESLALLEKLPAPKNVWKYFLLCTETPRVSHKLDGFRSVLTELAPKLNCDSAIDEAGNLRLRKKASAGCENAPRICIQAHLDMVTSANSDITFNFETDPINVFVTDKKGQPWMQAKGTTLGADNGLGLAAALALLEAANNNEFPHGQLEALFTADEETTMGGAENLSKAPFVDSDILLNVDSEEENSICIGCAGGMENDFVFQVARSAREDHKLLSVTLKGLLGGHSGIEIHLGRANALKCLNKLFRLANNAIDNTAVYAAFQVDNAANVIPREAKATISIPAKSYEQFKQVFQEKFELLKDEYLSVEHRIDDAGVRRSVMILEIDESQSDVKPLDISSSAKVSDFIETFHSGVIRLNYDVKDLVETSINLSTASIRDDQFYAYSFARSSSKTGLEQVQDSLEAFARLSGSRVSKPLNPFPGWDPDISSVALTEMKAAYKDALGLDDPRIYAVHAGLECGFIQGAYPEISCISVGPEIHHAHSPDECLLIPSVPRFYDLVVQFITRMSKLQRA